MLGFHDAVVATGEFDSEPVAEAAGEEGAVGPQGRGEKWLAEEVCRKIFFCHIFAIRNRRDVLLL